MVATASDPSGRTHRDHIASQQLDALFGTVLVGVTGAAFGAWVVIYLLILHRAIGGAPGYAWASYISGCAVLHALLTLARWLLKPPEEEWRPWALLFTVVGLLEGFGWGVLPVMVGAAQDFTYEMVTLTVSLTIVTASITAFSPYFPAFTAFFFPSTVPYFLWAASIPNVEHRATASLMLIFIGAIFQLARISSRRFLQMLRLQIEKDEQVKLAAVANARLSTFLAMASHELRTPAQDLSNRAATLASNPTLSGSAQRDAEDIYQRSQVINEMFGAMLNLSLLEAGKKTPNKRDLALSPMLQAIRDECLKDAQKKGLELHLVPTSAAVHSDGPMLSVIVSNLVRNAIRYTQKGKVLIGVRIKPQSGTVLIQVLDTGPGIKPEDQGQIFGAFYQVGAATTGTAQGAGLGLTIVQRFAALLDARLRVRSKVGRGSLFEVSVPLAVNPIPRETEGIEARLQVSRFIAFVDDDDAIVESTTALLQSWGHRVLSATSGDAIVLALGMEALRPDLIISDYQLRDDENGIEVIERLRSEYNEEIPALLLTGDSTAATLAHAQAAGVPLLQSPVPDKNLRAAVSGLTGKRPDTSAERGSNQIKPA
jgi:signal transduction histidine kinase/CheY-like chemotaxis protein